MDDPSFYGFPVYGEATVKAAQDCGGPLVDPERRTDETDAEMQSRLADTSRADPAGHGRPGALAALPVHPDPRPRLRDLARYPGLESVVVGMGAAHAFKFAPTFGRLLADLAVDRETSTDLTPFRMDRPGADRPGLPVPLAGVRCRSVHSSSCVSRPSSPATAPATHSRSCARLTVR